MDWGFSKSSAPNSVNTTDWCSYETNFGYATSNAQLEDACSRIQRFCAAVK